MLVFFSKKGLGFAAWWPIPSKLSDSVWFSDCLRYLTVPPWYDKNYIEFLLVVLQSDKTAKNIKRHKKPICTKYLCLFGHIGDMGII